MVVARSSCFCQWAIVYLEKGVFLPACQCHDLCHFPRVKRQSNLRLKVFFASHTKRGRCLWLIPHTCANSKGEHKHICCLIIPTLPENILALPDDTHQSYTENNSPEAGINSNQLRNLLVQFPNVAAPTLRGRQFSSPCQMPTKRKPAQKYNIATLARKTTH